MEILSRNSRVSGEIISRLRMLSAHPEVFPAKCNQAWHDEYLASKTPELVKKQGVILKEFPSMSYLKKKLSYTWSEDEFWAAFFHAKFEEKDEEHFRDNTAYTLTKKEIANHEIDEVLYFRDLEIQAQKGVSKSLKFLIRKGIPDHLRPRIWLAISGSDDFLMKKPDWYKKLTKVTFKDTVPEKPSVYPEFGGTLRVSDHCVVPEAEFAAKRVLCCLSSDLHLAYAPVIPDLCLLLLAFFSESDTAAIVHTLAKKSIKKTERSEWLLTNAAEVALFFLTFESLIQQKLPKLHQHFAALEIKSSEYAEPWFLRIFVGTLSYQSVLRVFDCFLNEGTKVIYRIGLAILKIFQDEILKMATKTQILTFLWSMGTKKIDCEELIKIAFKFRLSRSGVTSHNLKNKKDVPSLLTRYSKSEAPIVYYRPSINFDGSILSIDQFEILWSWLPARYRIRDPNLLFNAEMDGYNLRTAYAKLKKVHPSIVVVRTKQKNIFGFYSAISWDSTSSDKNGMGSVGESFLFRFGETPAKYSFTQKNKFFHFEYDFVGIGGGGKGFGLYLNENMSRGSTAACETFDNPCLNGEEETFDVQNVQIFTIV